MSDVVCLDCHQPIQPTSIPFTGQRITCPNCGAELEILNVDPVELDWAYLEPSQTEKGWTRWTKPQSQKIENDVPIGDAGTQ